MKTKVYSNRYQATHGKSPKGRGSWAFHPDFNVDASSPEIFWFNGTFADAKKAAIAHFGTEGIGWSEQVEVLS